MQMIEDKLRSALQKFDSLRKAPVLGDNATQAGYDSHSLQKLEDMATALKRIRQEESQVLESLYRKKTLLHRLENAKTFGMAIPDDQETRRKVAAEIIHSLIRTPSQFYLLLKAVGFSPDNDMRGSITLALEAIRGCSISEITRWLAEPEVTMAKLEGEVQQLKQQFGECQDQVEALTRERDAANTAREAENSRRRTDRDTLKARDHLALKEDEIQNLQMTHEEELSRLRQEHQEEVRRLRLGHEQDLRKLKREHQSELDLVRQGLAGERSLQGRIEPTVKPVIPRYSFMQRHRARVWEKMYEVDESSAGMETSDVDVNQHRED
ncbi:hypothetical protein N0V84_011312 [Fusarium piperis]|uniref:Uncharacterized protein n=1 Tax=Fusarium piperis TaxID=1435070 RepID=A0A9W8TCE2_9HYPO|nr:hypothetical protein N0V84_011312 [Fusarium piperis]